MPNKEVKEDEGSKPESHTQTRTHTHTHTQNHTHTTNTHQTCSHMRILSKELEGYFGCTRASTT